MYIQIKKKARKNRTKRINRKKKKKKKKKNINIKKIIFSLKRDLL